MEIDGRKKKQKTNPSSICFLHYLWKEGIVIHYFFNPFILDEKEKKNACVIKILNILY